MEGFLVGKGNERNKICECGSGLKKKFCKCQENDDSSLDAFNLFKEQFKINKDGVIINPLGVVRHDEYPDLKKEEPGSEKWWYAPLCNQEQINRIFYPTNAMDYILKVQANSILDNMRLTRVMYARMNSNKKSWNIESQFDDTLYKCFKKEVDDDTKRLIDQVTCGFVYDNDSNGYCVKSEFGNVILISEALKKFLYYMNLNYYDLGGDSVPPDVRFHSLILGIRIMLQNESMDFELDPRGIVPRDIDRELNELVNEQILFVIGHEYSHILLGHLDKSNMVEKRIMNSKESLKIYNNSQKQEFIADEKAISLPSYSLIEKRKRIYAAILFFLCLDIFEAAKEQIYPSISRIKTHPSSMDRIEKLLEVYGEELLIDKNDIKNSLDYNLVLKKHLQEEIAVNFESFEAYGSVYLGSWRGPVLQDRIDY